ncbi:MAG: Mov34/MPN/PAD-1 family protein [archaeon]|jgi:proteasome lid subunit RPN8/RPN11
MGWKIKKNVIEAIMAASKAAYPNEFVTLLSGSEKEKIVDEYAMLPGDSGPTFATVGGWGLDAYPVDEKLIGSAHSHPSNSNLPSIADKKFFKQYFLNTIICAPFEIQNFAFYNANGEKIGVEIIE